MLSYEKKKEDLLFFRKPVAMVATSPNKTFEEGLA
jgi:hypothetical protein